MWCERRKIKVKNVSLRGSRDEDEDEVVVLWSSWRMDLLLGGIGIGFPKESRMGLYL